MSNYQKIKKETLKSLVSNGDLERISKTQDVAAGIGSEILYQSPERIEALRDEANSDIVRKLQSISNSRDIQEYRSEILSMKNESFARSAAVSQDILSTNIELLNEAGEASSLEELALNIRLAEDSMKAPMLKLKTAILGRKKSIERQKAQSLQKNLGVIEEKVEDVVVNNDLKRGSIENQLNQIYDNYHDVEEDIVYMFLYYDNYRKEVENFREVNPREAAEMDEKILPAIEDRIVDMVASKMILETSVEILSQERKKVDAIEGQMRRVRSVLVPTLALNSYIETVADSNDRDSKLMSSMQKTTEVSMIRTVNKSVESTKSMAKQVNSNILDLDKIGKALEEAMRGTEEARKIEQSQRQQSLLKAKNSLEISERAKSNFSVNKELQ